MKFAANPLRALKPPLFSIQAKTVTEYSLRKRRDGSWWLSVIANRFVVNEIGPFADEAAARAAYDDLLATMRSAGAVDVAAQ